eukprot:1133811-Pelagomonas_calceolata.AAC.11
MVYGSSIQLNCRGPNCKLVVGSVLQPKSSLLLLFCQEPTCKLVGIHIFCMDGLQWHVVSSKAF